MGLDFGVQFATLPDLDRGCYIWMKIILSFTDCKSFFFFLQWKKKKNLRWTGKRTVNYFVKDYDFNLSLLFSKSIKASERGIIKQYDVKNNNTPLDNVIIDNNEGNK